jgi:hypothetical protein
MTAVLGTQEQKKWRSRGADPNVESFYTTEYASKYYRPRTTVSSTRSLTETEPAAPDVQWTSEYTAKYTRPQTTIGHGDRGTTRRRDTGYASNEHVSPVDLAPREDRQDYQTTHCHETHNPDSSVMSLLKPKAMVRAAMERSGYWREPMPNVLYDSPAARVVEVRERRANAASLDPITLKRMTHHNAIDGENSGAGPEWGSTTYGTAYHEHESNQSRYWKTDRSLIGKREPDAYTRQHVTVPRDPVDEQVSVYTTSYRPPPQGRDIHVPNRVVMERSGFTYSSIPTHNNARPLSDVTADDLPSLTIHRMKHKNTPEYQNLLDPDPYKTTDQISYRRPERTADRALTAGYQVRRGATGYNSNETIHAGPPGDPRWAQAGITEFQDKYVDPTPTIRSRGIKGCPNVMERSGYWSQ